MFSRLSSLLKLVANYDIVKLGDQDLFCCSYNVKFIIKLIADLVIISHTTEPLPVVIDHVPVYISTYVCKCSSSHLKLNCCIVHWLGWAFPLSFNAE